MTMSNFQWYQVITKAGEKGFHGFPIGDIINALSISNKLGKSTNLCQKLLWKGEKQGLLIRSVSAKEIDKKVIEVANEPVEFVVPKNKFRNPELIINIHKELSKQHLEDDREKLTSFIGCCTAYLKPAELHKSPASIGSSSVGKDNLIKTTLKLFPPDDWIFLTNATQSAMEDDIQKYKIIAYSEMNMNKEDGANAHLLEILKQMTEGGTSSIKKDVITGYKIAKHVVQQQKTVLYGTTEEETDEEIDTRYIKIGVKGHPTKTKIVNEKTLDWFSGLNSREHISEWVAEGIALLQYKKVIIPYAPLLKGKIDGRDIFDYQDPRSMRDVKRLMAYTCGIAWIYQKQREIKDECIISKPIDFLMAVTLCGQFFNQTYKGLGDSRLQAYLHIMRQYEKDNKGVDTIPRNYIQETLKVSRSTVKRYSKVLSNMGFIKWKYSEGNIQYYERCPKGVQRPLIGVQVDELKNYFNGIKGVQITKEHCNLLEKLEKIAKKGELDEDYSTPVENGHPEMDTPNDDDLIMFVKEKKGEGYPVDKFISYRIFAVNGLGNTKCSGSYGFKVVDVLEPNIVTVFVFVDNMLYY